MDLTPVGEGAMGLAASLRRDGVEDVVSRRWIDPIA